YLTSRGIGVLDVNYGGSSGYGRAYRERLDGQWGIVDVDDVLAAVAGLVAEGDADAARIAIAGGSAGGWTVLAALAGSDVFAAGI
ncbi:prolyl oligopeptidase family serine peptidase, partial [Acinetobacter baumannii]